MTKREMHTHCAFCSKPLELDNEKITHKKYCGKKCQDALYYQQNREKVRAIQKRFNQTEDKKKRAARRKKWQQENPVRYALQKRAEYSNAKAKKVGAAGTLTTKEVAAMVEARGWICEYCGKQLDHKTLTLDHMQPFSRGGLNFIENVTASCLSCNKSKASKTFEEFKK